MPKRLTRYQILKIVNLARTGESLAKISKKLKLTKTTVYYHARNYCRKMTTLDLNLLAEFEKGYIIGFFLGDGSLDKGRKAPRYIVRFAVDAKRDRDIATRLALIFEKACKKVSTFCEGNTLIVKVCSKELVEFIQMHIEFREETNNRKEKLLLVGEDWSSEFQYGLLAGIIDSDGHVHRHLGTEIKTASPSTFKAILSLLNNLGIIAKTKRLRAENRYSKKDYYTIYISSFQIKTYGDKIPSVKIKRFF